MRRWSHMHSVGSGLIVALLIERNGWLILLGLGLAFLLGWLSHAARKRIGSAVHTGGALLAARVATEVERGKNARASRRLKLEQARSLRRERDEIDRKAYWRGVRDGTP